jgi:aspergillopepsin I
LSGLDKPLFAVTLKHGAPGTYDFGYIDKKKFTGSLTRRRLSGAWG